MEKIESFRVNHLTLMQGLYVSRRDKVGSEDVTTFDLRFTMPNREPVMDMPAIHTIEHLGATYLRNCDIKDKIIYFGPMGCRTGFYLITSGNKRSEDIYPIVLDMCDFIMRFQGEIPGATPQECGNYSEQNLSMAKYYIDRYRTELKNKRFVYPQ